MRTTERMEWERTRWMGFVYAKMMGAKSIHTPQDLMLLEHEGPTEDEKKRKLELLKRFPERI